MNNKEILAEALEMAPEILPYLSELLADIQIFGSWPEKIIELLRPLDLLPHSTSVLDLGCGKGTVTLPIVQELEFRILGVDLFPPFIEEARVRAKKIGVANLCQYEVGDIRDVLKEGKSYDVVIFASLSGVLGDFAHCVEQLGLSCWPSGYIVIDDGFLTHSTRLDRSGYQHYCFHDETIQQLTGHGDTLVQEILIPVEKLRAYNPDNTELTRNRAKKLSLEHPDIADSLDRYVQWEEVESYVLETETTPAIQLLRRA